METSYLYQRKFSAGHALERCSNRPHGHDFTVTVAFRAESLAGEAALDGCIAEIDLRNLAEMLPAVPPTCAGIANWLFGRLRSEGPVTRVTVWQSMEIGAEVTETPL